MALKLTWFITLEKFPADRSLLFQDITVWFFVGKMMSVRNAMQTGITGTSRLTCLQCFCLIIDKIITFKVPVYWNSLAQIFTQVFKFNFSLSRIWSYRCIGKLKICCWWKYTWLKFEDHLINSPIFCYLRSSIQSSVHTKSIRNAFEQWFLPYKWWPEMGAWREQCCFRFWVCRSQHN
jgi:hypothetical protein